MNASKSSPPKVPFPLGRSIVSAGKVHVQDLAEIKRRFGENWGRMSTVMHQHFNAVLAHEMGPGDTFWVLDELTYVTLFASLSIHEAEVKCASIMHDVCWRLFGEKGENLALRNLVGPIDRATLSRSRNVKRAISEALELGGHERIVDVFSPLVADAKPSDNAIPVRSNEADATRHYISRSKPAFLFRPLWDVPLGVVLSYLCQPLPRTLRGIGSPLLSGFHIADVDHHVELDTLILNHCAGHLARLRKEGHRILLAVPVHFETLGRTRAWRCYEAARNQIPPEVLRDITFVVHGVDKGVPHIRLADALPRLSRHARHVMCLMEDDENVAARLTNCGVHSVGLWITGANSEKQWITRLNALSKSASKNGLEAFVLGANSASIALNCTGAGVRYVEGSAIGPMVGHPRHAFLYEVEDLYSPLRKTPEIVLI